MKYLCIENDLTAVEAFADVKMNIKTSALTLNFFP